MKLANLLKEVAVDVHIKWLGGELALLVPKYYRLQATEEALSKAYDESSQNLKSIFVGGYKGKFSAPVYNEAMKELKEDPTRLSPASFQKLTKDKPELAIALVEDLERVSYEEACNYAVLMLGRVEISETTEEMLEQLKENQKQFEPMVTELVAFYQSEVQKLPYLNSEERAARDKEQGDVLRQLEALGANATS